MGNYHPLIIHATSPHSGKARDYLVSIGADLDQSSRRENCTDGRLERYDSDEVNSLLKYDASPDPKRKSGRGLENC